MMRRISTNLPDNFVPDSEREIQGSASDSLDLAQIDEDSLLNPEEKDFESARSEAQFLPPEHEDRELSSASDEPSLQLDEDRELSSASDKTSLQLYEDRVLSYVSDVNSLQLEEDREPSSVADETSLRLEEEQELSSVSDEPSLQLDEDRKLSSASDEPSLQLEKDREVASEPYELSSLQPDEKLTQENNIKETKSQGIRRITLTLPKAEEDDSALQQKRENAELMLTELADDQSALDTEQESMPESEHDSSQKVEPADWSDTEHASVIPRIPRAQLLYPGFDNAMGFLRENFKLPREIQMNQQKSSRTWLLSKVNKIESAEEIAAFAYSLSRNDQALLFPVLATLKKKGDIEKLEEIILLLSNKSLYIHGWLTLQFAYPRSTVATTLTKLCLKLEDTSFYGHNYSSQKFHRNQRYADGGSKTEIIWSKVPLITEISQPNSRHFISDLVDYYLDSGLDYQEFCRRYAIYTDLRLGIAISEKIEDKISKEGTNFLLGKRFFSQN